MDEPSPPSIQIALLTFGLRPEWETAIGETIRGLATGPAGIRARVVRRQEAAGTADIALVVYSATRHGDSGVTELLRLASSPTAPSWSKLCIAACDWSDKPVSENDVERLIDGLRSNFTGRFVEVGAFQERLSEWIRATAAIASVSGGPDVASWEDGPADTDSISERGEPCDPGWN